MTFVTLQLALLLATIRGFFRPTWDQHMASGVVAILLTCLVCNAPMAFSFPRLPILISGYTAIAIAHVIYEVLHAVHHQPYELFWKPRLEHPIFGGAWTWLYGFHQAHHANYRCNINVAGFFGIPLADLVFGTYRRPSPLLLDGARATKADARRLLPQPRWPVSWFDRIVFKRRRWMVRRP